MYVSKLATSFALATSLAASQVAAQVAIQQPGAMMPATARSAPATPDFRANVQQPVPYANAPATTPTTPSVAMPAVQQPAGYATTTPQRGAALIAPPVQQPVGLFATTAAPLAVQPAPPVHQPNTFAAADAPAVSQPAAPAIQQPGPFAAAAVATPNAQPAVQAIQHPGAFNQPSTIPATSAVMQQPSAIGQPPAPSLFTSYYDEAEDEEEGDDEEDEDSDGCGDDVGCGDDCEKDANFCGWTCGGWFQQGITFNGYNPHDGFNGTVIMNDLANQWMGNQMWLYTEREIEAGNCGWEYGGRVDLVYGTDAFFMQMNDGLEESWNQDSQYVFSPLRFYLDVAYNNWTLRGGRFDNPVGYEPWDATESFFYSRSYAFYAEAGSLFGLMLTNHLNDQLSLSAGLHRGDSQFDDTDGKNSVDFVGGGEWISTDEETWVDVYVLAEEQGISKTRTDYSVVGGKSLANDWEYVIEWYWGQADQPGQLAEWYGIEQQLTKEINDCWSHGFRFEWFRDDDGFIITGSRPRNVLGPFTGNFYELTYAVNYRPCENFVLRPEVRWDWYKADDGGPEPFDDGTRSNQFLVSLDAIYSF